MIRGPWRLIWSCACANGGLTNSTLWRGSLGAELPMAEPGAVAAPAGAAKLMAAAVAAISADRRVIMTSIFVESVSMREI